jgi:hypothetical protein
MWQLLSSAPGSELTYIVEIVALPASKDLMVTPGGHVVVIGNLAALTNLGRLNPYVVCNPYLFRAGEERPDRAGEEENLASLVELGKDGPAAQYDTYYLAT